MAPNKRDIEIPQGIAHAIDRVMFPLPVGDLMQTLQADRERRFTTFIKLLHSSGLDEMLSGKFILFYCIFLSIQILLFFRFNPFYVLTVKSNKNSGTFKRASEIFIRFSKIYTVFIIVAKNVNENLICLF